VARGIEKRVSRHITQERCPYNVRFAGDVVEPDYAARGPGESPVGVHPTASSAGHPGTESPSLVELLRTALDEESWESFSRGSALRRAAREGFARNVAVALGNWGDPSAVPVLSQGLDAPDALIRAHSAWALGRVGSAEALSALHGRLRIEEIASVREEVERALEVGSLNRK